MPRGDNGAAANPALPFTRRRFVAALGALALGAPRALWAQQRRVIGYLANQDVHSMAQPPATFRQFVETLRSLGWNDTRLEVRIMVGGGSEQRFEALAAELVKAKVDVIMTTGSASTRAALKATKTIPIVFGSAGNPVEQGFVASLARPGGNVTGFAVYLDEVAPKRLQLLKEMLPGASRIARFHAVGNVGGQTALRRRYDEAASALGMTLQHFALSRAEVAAAFAKARADRVHAVIIEADPIFMVDTETKEKDRGRVARLALEHRMPVMSADVRYVEDGCLIGYSEDLPAQYGRAATYVDRILKGTRPEDLPVQQGSVQLVVNAATARALGLKIPHSIRVQANVIKE